MARKRLVMRHLVRARWVGKPAPRQRGPCTHAHAPITHNVASAPSRSSRASAPGPAEQAQVRGEPRVKRLHSLRSGGSSGGGVGGTRSPANARTRSRNHDGTPPSAAPSSARTAALIARTAPAPCECVCSDLRVRLVVEWRRRREQPGAGTGTRRLSEERGEVRKAHGGRGGERAAGLRGERGMRRCAREGQRGRERRHWGVRVRGWGLWLRAGGSAAIDVVHTSSARNCGDNGATGSKG